MGTSKRLPVFEKFIQDIRAAWPELPDTESRMKRVKLLLEGLVKDPSIKEASKHWPSTEGHKNLLLYEDPNYGFVINAVVRTSNREVRVHDHDRAWTAYGVLEGTEWLER
jgi:predicted metal-dependent enzyme (double-stranded beta helix superfamily)